LDPWIQPIEADFTQHWKDINLMKLSLRRFVSSSAGAVVAAGLGAEARAMLIDDVP
jgi:hypothetical protein